MFTLFLFYSIVTPQCVVEIEKRKSNFTPWSSFFSIYADVTVGECNVFTLFLFYSIVTPKCDVEIEKKKSNVNTFTLLFHLFFLYIFIQVLANVMCSHYFSFYSIITSQCVVEIEEHFSILLYGAFFGQAQLKLSWWYCQLIQPSTDPPSLSRILNVDCFQSLFMFILYIFRHNCWRM